MTQQSENQLPTLWRPRWGLALAVLICLLSIVPGQHSIPPMDRDEARFAQASKQMLESGDIVTVRFQDEIRAKKPAGIYWLQSISAAVLGDEKIGSYRVPSMLAGIMICLIGFWLAQQMVPPQEASIATMIMATSLVLAGESHLAKTDAMLAAITLGQQALLWRIFSASRAGEYVSGIFAAGFWVCLAAGVLIKGPVTPMIGVMTALSVSIGSGGWRWLWSLRPMLGFIIVTVLVLPWVVLVTHATDGSFLKIAFRDDLLSKLQGGQESHGAPPLTHLFLLLLTLWPGSLLLARALRVIRGCWREPEIIFLLGWVVPFWVVIEIIPTKLPHYMLPVMPALAILAALGARVDLPRLRTGVKVRRLNLSVVPVYCWEILFMLASLGLGFAVLTAATLFGGSRMAGFYVLLLTIAIASVGYTWFRRPRLSLLVVLMLLASGFHAATFGFVIPSLSDIHLGPRLKAAVESIEPKPVVIAAAGYHEPSMVFALGTEILLYTPEDAALFLVDAPEGIALVEGRARDKFISVMDEVGGKAEVVTKIDGYNISRGQRVQIEIFRAPKTAGDGN